VPGLATRLGYSRRQLERALGAELGAGPLGIARAHRAQTARLLVETTGLPFTDVAFAAGFGSVRQFNDTVREVFATTPGDLRAKAKQHGGSRGSVSLRLPFRQPLFPDNLFGHLVATAVPGVEEWRDGAYRRTLRLPHGPAIVELAPTPDHIRCTLSLQDLRDLSTAIARCRRLLDLDADPEAVIDVLNADRHLAPLVAKAPGQRIPRTVDENELALRVVIGQQVSMKAAATHTRRLALAYGTPINDPAGALTHVFPSVTQLAEIDPSHLAFPESRRRTVVALIDALAAGTLELDAGSDWLQARTQLAELPGIGPWTAEVIAMRGLGDPDAFPASDLGVQAAAKQAGLPDNSRQLIEHSAHWRPWRAYATQHLWTSLDHAVNQWPPLTTNPSQSPQQEQA
jgi:AraC family transcriptional regulator of adaptative response / DNA-3-methyladenine glycosylase II